MCPLQQRPNDRREERNAEDRMKSYKGALITRQRGEGSKRSVTCLVNKEQYRSRSAYRGYGNNQLKISKIQCELSNADFRMKGQRSPQGNREMLAAIPKEIGNLKLLSLERTHPDPTRLMLEAFSSSESKGQSSTNLRLVEEKEGDGEKTYTEVGQRMVMEPPSSLTYQVSDKNMVRECTNKGDLVLEQSEIEKVLEEEVSKEEEADQSGLDIDSEMVVLGNEVNEG